MKKIILSLLLAAGILGGGVLAQTNSTEIAGDRVVTGRLDMTTAEATLPFKTGSAASRPATCSIGEVYFQIDTSIGIYCCRATNTWSSCAVAVSGGSTLESETNVTLKPDTNADGTGTDIEVYGTFSNYSSTYPTAVNFDLDFTDDGSGVDSDLTTDLQLVYDGTNSGIVLTNGAGFIQFGLSSTMHVRLVSHPGPHFHTMLMFDEDGDNTDDGDGDWCWGFNGRDDDCDGHYEQEGYGTTTGQILANTGGVIQGEDAFRWLATLDLLSLGIGLDSAGIDISGDETADISWDGSGVLLTGTGGAAELVWNGDLTDCDGDGSALGYDTTTKSLVCGDDDSGGAGTQVDIDGDSTKEIDLSGGVLNLDPDEDGTVEWAFGTPMSDCDGDGSAVMWDQTTGQFSCGDDDTSGGAATQVDMDGDGTREISLASAAVLIDPDQNGTAELTIDATGNSFSWDINNDGTSEFSYDADATAKNYFCMDPDDNGNCDFQFVDEGSDATPQVGIRFHGAAKPTILHDENAKTFVIDNDEDGTYEFNLDGSAVQITLDPNSDGVNDMLLNQAFLQTDQVRYSTEASARMTTTNARMHMCGGNQFAPTAAAGACMALGGSTGTYASTIYFDPDGDATAEATINTSGDYSGKAATATALAADPTDCGTNAWATTIAASGNLTCSAVSGGAGVTDGTVLEADLAWDSTAARTAGQSILVGTDTTKFTTGVPATASALAADPTDCGANTWATTIAASGNLTCNAVSGGAGITDGTILGADLTWDNTASRTAGQSVLIGTDTTKFVVGVPATASALASDPTDCGANTWATTIAASGNLTCSAVSGGAGVTDGTILEADLTWDNTATRTAGQYITVGTDTTKFLAVTPTQTLTFTGATAVLNADPPLIKAPYGMTITAIHCAVWAATSIPLSVEECDSSIGSCAGVDGGTSITCDIDGAADDGALSNPSIDSGDWIKLNFGSATGTIVGGTVTIYYTTP